MNAIDEFCKTRNINDKIKEAFITYVKVSYSSSFAVRSGDTLSKMIANMTMEKVEDMWGLFVIDFKQTLPQET